MVIASASTRLVSSCTRRAPFSRARASSSASSRRPSPSPRALGATQIRLSSPIRFGCSRSARTRSVRRPNTPPTAVRTDAATSHRQLARNAPGRTRSRIAHRAQRSTTASRMRISVRRIDLNKLNAARAKQSLDLTHRRDQPFALLGLNGSSSCRPRRRCAGQGSRARPVPTWSAGDPHPPFGLRRRR